MLSEGKSDAALLPIIMWVFRQQIGADSIVTGDRVDEGRLPKTGNRLRLAIETYPCDFLIIHRDADGENWEVRKREIASWCEETTLADTRPIAIVPVRETEAWLLVDAQAIRRAAGNPNGRVDLKLPAPNKLEQLVDAKEHLLATLRLASELSGRRLKKFDERGARLLIGEKISDYRVLRALKAFERFEAEVRHQLLEAGIGG